MAKLLIIEDDPYVFRLYQHLFKIKNYAAEFASTGEEGLIKAQTINPDVILLDMRMPGINGLEVLQTLKENQLTKSIPVLVLSNDYDDVIEDSALKAGASEYLVKSQFDPDDLVEKIENYLPKENPA
jgi:CheY-like chemotaxis protein